MFKWLRNMFGRKPTATSPTVHVRARYDAAQTNHDNSRHWAAADGLSASAANSPGVRTILRKRARYECSNNGIAAGIVSTLANDVIGTGPRLQIQAARELTRPIERAFRRWCDEVNLADKLRTMRRSRAVDGECFAVFTNNPNLMSPVQLDVRLVEADRVADPSGVSFGPANGWLDGVRYDATGTPIAYQVLNTHPGDTGYAIDSFGAKEYAARAMVHDFKCERPGQLRGVPEMVSTLGLFAEMRRYTSAVLAAAETAADFAWFLKSTSPEIPVGAGADPFSTIDIERRMGQVLPAHWDVSQLKAEQPTTTYGDFRRNLVNEAARPLNMPYNVAACDSSSYNYASGRMDHQVYQRAITIDREQYARRVLDPLLYAWLNEAALVPGLIPDGLGPFASWDWAWHWDGFLHVDPAKEANAQATRLTNHTTTLAAEYATRGEDWQEQIEQRAKELEMMRALGLSVPVANTTEQEEPEPAEAIDDDEA